MATCTCASGSEGDSPLPHTPRGPTTASQCHGGAYHRLPRAPGPTTTSHEPQGPIHRLPHRAPWPPPPPPTCHAAHHRLPQSSWPHHHLPRATRLPPTASHELHGPTTTSHVPATASAYPQAPWPHPPPPMHPVAPAPTPWCFLPTWSPLPGIPAFYLAEWERSHRHGEGQASTREGGQLWPGVKASATGPSSTSHFPQVSMAGDL